MASNAKDLFLGYVDGKLWFRKTDLCVGDDGVGFVDIISAGETQWLSPGNRQSYCLLVLDIANSL